MTSNTTSGTATSPFRCRTFNAPAPARLGMVERARRYIDKMEPAISGQGGHNRTFAAACALRQTFGLSFEEALPLMQEYNERCIPPWPEKPLQRKLREAEKAKPYGWANQGAGSQPVRTTATPFPRTAPKTPEQLKAEQEANVTKFLNGFRCTEHDLIKASPVKLTGSPQEDLALFLAACYRQGEWVNIVTSYGQREPGKAHPVGKGETVERDRLIEQVLASGVTQSSAGGWIRLNPMDGKGGTDANVTAFRLVLLEADHLPRELQASLIAKLPLPIRAITDSGSRSLHALVDTGAQSLQDYAAFVAKLFTMLAPLGIDTANKNPSRLSRLPMALRIIGAPEGGKLQRLLYLNPNPQPEQSILE